MAKILELNGKKYSKQQFENYKNRAKVKISTNDGDYDNLDIYTTDENKESVLSVLKSRITEKVQSIEIFHWCTKEQDDANAELINELFN